MCRSREGAWIEIAVGVGRSAAVGRVAPARERGLKSLSAAGRSGRAADRSREGAWIEMPFHRALGGVPRSLPRGSVD